MMVDLLPDVSFTMSSFELEKKKKKKQTNKTKQYGEEGEEVCILKI